MIRDDSFFRQFPICLQHKLHGLNQVFPDLFQGLTLGIDAREFFDVPDIPVWRLLEYRRQWFVHRLSSFQSLVSDHAENTRFV